MYDMDQEEGNPCRDPIRDGIVLDVTQENLGGNELENTKSQTCEQEKHVTSMGRLLNTKNLLNPTKKKVTSLKGMSLPEKEGSYHDLSHSPNASLLDHACLQFRMKHNFI
jgi:hypothetical protein